MKKGCMQFLTEPTKRLKVRLKKSLKQVKLEKKEPLAESQCFIMELARDLNKICQMSNILCHIWKGEDIWPASLCRDFIMEWAAVLEKTVQSELILSDYQHYERLEKKDWIEHLLCILEAGGEHDMWPYKRVIMDWTRDLKSRNKCTIWPGEKVIMMLDDFEFQWKMGHLTNLLPAMELIMLTMLDANSPVKEDVTKQWLVRKQSSKEIDAARYIPHTVWDWICDAAEEVTLDSDTANPDLLISSDGKRMRCDLERRREVPQSRCCFGWWCAVGQEGYTSGRHYWEVEVGERDWRLGVAKASAVKQGFRSFNTDTGYLTLRLERATDLKALTVPFTLLSQSIVPRKVGVYLDYEQGQLSFYNVEKRSHLYTFNEKFTEGLYPVFGTVEVVKYLVIRPADVRQPCLCPKLCLWNGTTKQTPVTLDP